GEVFDLVYFGVPSLRLTGKRSTGTTGYDGILFAVLREASRCGALVGVTPANSEVTDFLAGTYLSEAKISPDYHGRSWPAFLEKESVVKAAVYAEATASHVHVFGLSTAAGLQEIEQARVKGVQITCETHPYYLLLTKERMYDEQEGSIYITAPPLREEQDVTRLWLGLRTGSVQTVSSGHRGLWRSQKREPLTFADIPPGLGCIEAMLPLLYSEGVIRNLISPERLVEMLSYNPACLFGLYPEKGTVAVGADADLIIFDPRRTSVLSLESLHGKSDVQPFADWDITGAVEMTFLRGQVVYHNGEVLGSPGTGRFVKRIPLE
ncbi:MAG: amidohydrolase family protein, partial [bacterium]|nr:amidohydrolase family protein [bacterium]